MTGGGQGLSRSQNKMAGEKMGVFFCTGRISIETQDSSLQSWSMLQRAFCSSKTGKWTKIWTEVFSFSGSCACMRIFTSWTRVAVSYMQKPPLFPVCDGALYFLRYKTRKKLSAKCEKNMSCPKAAHKKECWLKGYSPGRISRFLTAMPAAIVRRGRT